MLITRSFEKVVTKPSCEIEIKRLSKSINSVFEGSVKDISNVILNNVWCPSIYKDCSRRNINWIKSDLLVLDLDKHHTIEDINSVCKTHGLKVNIIGQTLSSLKHDNKRRVVFALDVPISETSVYKHILVNLIYLFEHLGCDKKCHDFARMFYPIKDVELVSEELNSVEHLLSIANLTQIVRDGNKLRGIKVIKDTKKVSDDNRDVIKTVKNIKISDIIEKFELLKRFDNGEWLYHVELFGLATNLLYITGGLKYMKGVMEKYNLLGKTNYTDNNFAILSYVKARKYYPQEIKMFSKYESDWGFKNVLEVVKDNNCAYIYDNKVEKLKLEDVENSIGDIFNGVLDTIKKGELVIIKGASGLGKSQLLADTLKERSVTIATPTHELKTELKSRFKVDVLTTPNIPKFSPAVTKHIKGLFENGLIEDVYSYIKLTKEGKNQKSTSGDVLIAKKYYDELTKAYNYDGVVITTHSKASRYDFNSDFLIFDECPLNDMVVQNSLFISEIIKIEHNVRKFKVNGLENIIKLRNNLFTIEDGETKRTVDLLLDSGLTIEKFDEIATELAKKGCKVNFYLKKFINSSTYLKDIDGVTIHFSTVNLPGNDKKVIIMSASAPESIYKGLFGNNVKVIDLSNIESVGEVIQYANKSFSKTQLKNVSVNELNELKDKAKGTKIITHKGCKGEFENSNNKMHFFNCSGYDELKGEDISVIGTPHKKEYQYLLLASAMGVFYKRSELKFVNQKLNWRGNSFVLPSFNDRLLTEIQCSLIESELIQAAGRNRYLRESCKTIIFSNFLLYISTKVYS